MLEWATDVTKDTAVWPQYRCLVRFRKFPILHFRRNTSVWCGERRQNCTSC